MKNRTRKNKKPALAIDESADYNTHNFTLADFFSNFNYKVTKLATDDYTNILNKLNTAIPYCCKKPVTYYDVLDKLSLGFTKRVFLVGGAVRDYFITKDVSAIKDIDIMYSIDPKTLESVLQDLEIVYFKKNGHYNFIKIGIEDRDDQIEGSFIYPKLLTPYYLECKMNSLIISVERDKMQLIDLFNGESLYQAVHKIWEAPTTDYETWVSGGNKLLFRMLKFELRGYTVPIETKRAVYTFWVNNHYTIYEFNAEKFWLTLVDRSRLKEIIKIIYRDCDELKSEKLKSRLMLLFVNKGILVAG
jgi:hypothetical protein